MNIFVVIATRWCKRAMGQLTGALTVGVEEYSLCRMTITTCHHHAHVGSVDRFDMLTQRAHGEGFMETTKLKTYTEFRKAYDKSFRIFMETGNDDLMLKLEQDNEIWNLRMSFDIFREIDARYERKQKNDN